ncbi:MAG: helix-turn-helix domain-containing protein [Haloarculaceae archaeon]
MSVEDEAAVEGLTRLGLTTYEARVFLGLQKLGTGAAAEVTEVVDVPRSQVYGAAEGLEERGLLEIQQSTPTQYRPVSLERARSRLLDELERTGAETFDYLEDVRESAREYEEESEAIWLVRGSDSIASRVGTLAGDAGSRIRYGAPGPAHLEDEVLRALEEAAGEGIDVVVASEDAEVRSVVAEERGLTALPIPADLTPDVEFGRFTLVDDRTLLLSVHATAGGDGSTEEVAFWSADSTFAAVLVEVIEEWFLAR